MEISKRQLLFGGFIGLAGLTVSGSQAMAQSNRARRSSAGVPPIVAAWAKAWNAGDAAGMAALFTADGVYDDYAFQASWKGRKDIGQWVALTVANIPDAKVEIIDAWKVGNRPTVRWVFRGTPKRLADIPGTGKSFAVSAVSVFELRGGRITHVEDYYNLSNLLRQLGLPSGIWTPPVAGVLQ